MANIGTVRSSILREFTRKNPTLTAVGLSKQSTRIAPSKTSNAFVTTAPIVIHSEPMGDFEVDVLLRRHPEITADWQLPHCVTRIIPDWRTVINNEETLEHQVLVPVFLDKVQEGVKKLVDEKTRNRGDDGDLRTKHAQMVEKTDLRPDPLDIYIAKGSKSEFREIGPYYRSDWGLFSTLYNRNTHKNSEGNITECHNMLPAECKTSESFDITVLHQTNKPTHYKWKPVRQAIRYAKFAGPSRRNFTWIQTNEALVIMKIKYHDKDTSSAVDPSQSSQEQQPTPTDGSPVQPSTCSIQYKVIKWEVYWTHEHWANWNERKIPGPMTQHLGLMWVCWKAAFGDDDDLDNPPSGGTRSKTTLSIRTTKDSDKK